MSKTKIVLAALVSCLFLYAASGITEEKKAPAPAEKDKKAPAAKEKKEFTKEELLERINGTLEYNDEVVNFIKGLRKEADPQGKVFYSLEGVRLENLDKDQLTKVLRQVQSQVARINAERIAKQLESIQQTQRAIAATQAAGRISNISTPPSVPKPPQVPPVPTQVPKAQQAPPAPPAPPRK